MRPLLDRQDARLWVARAGAPPAIIGWFRPFDPLYPRTYWLQRPADFSLDARLLSDGPCRVELTLVARGYGTSMTNAAVETRPPR